MTRFGASAPYKILAERFGFAAANIVARAHELLGR
jgi:transketolase